MRPHFYTSANTSLLFYFIACAIICSALTLGISAAVNFDTWWGYNCTTIFSSIITFGIPPIIFWKWITDERLGKGLRINTPPRWRSMVYAVVLVFAVMPLIGYIISFTRDFLEYAIREDIFAALKNTETQREEMINALTAHKSWYTFPLVILTLSVIPALCEEFFFRGTLQRLLLRLWHKKTLAVLTTSVIFTIMHMDYFNWAGILLCSAIMGYLYLYTSSLWTSIAFHFVSNAWNVTMIYLTAHFPAQEGAENVHISPYMALASVFFVWFIFRTLRSVQFMERKLNK